MVEKGGGQRVTRGYIRKVSQIYKRAHTAWLLVKFDMKLYKGKAKVKQSHYSPEQAPEGSRRLRIPDSKTIGT